MGFLSGLLMHEMQMEAGKKSFNVAIIALSDYELTVIIVTIVDCNQIDRETNICVDRPGCLVFQTNANLK